MSWTDLQIALLHTLSAYESAEEASRIVGDRIEGQWRKADALHDELLKVSIACGFEPGGRHRHLSTTQFAQARAKTVAVCLREHLKEAGL